MLKLGFMNYLPSPCGAGRPARESNHHSKYNTLRRSLRKNGQISPLQYKPHLEF